MILFAYYVFICYLYPFFSFHINIIPLYIFLLWVTVGIFICSLFFIESSFLEVNLTLKCYITAVSENKKENLIDIYTNNSPTKESYDFMSILRFPEYNQAHEMDIPRSRLILS